jgi:hypothetical protein
MGALIRTLMPSLPLLIGKNPRVNRSVKVMRMTIQMTYSYSQISQYLRCPRSYRYRYLDGW